MLDTLDAEHFCNGHSEMTDREGIKNHIALMKKYHEKIRALTDKKKSLEEIKSEFEENEAALVETIYYEIMNQRQ